MGLTEADIDEGFIAEARAVLATGTHLSHPRTEAAVLKALEPRPQARREDGPRHRLPPEPLGRCRPRRGREPLRRERRGHAEAAGDAAPLRPDRRHRGGVPHRRRHHRHPRSAARGPRRLRRDARLQARRPRRLAFEGPIPASLDDGQTGPGFPIEVFNVLGAGDGFFSGLLRGWLTEQDWPTSLKFANACGAFAVSRHGCTPAYPSLDRARLLPRPRRRPPRSPQRRRARAGPLGHQPPARAWRRLLRDAGLRLRPPHAARGDGGCDPGEDRRLQAALPDGGARGGRRPPRLRHPLRQPPRPRGAARRLRHRPLDRPALRMAGLAAADARARARARLRGLERSGRARTWSRCSASATPTTRPRCAGTRRRR